MEANLRIECNLCGLSNYKVVYRKAADKTKKICESGDQYSITVRNIPKPDKLFKCNVCGLIFAQPEENFSYYVDRYIESVDREYLEEESGRRQASREILNRIEKHKKRGRLLDIGCANGFFLDEARRRGWEVYGLELSKWAANYAKEQLNLNVIKGTISEAKFEDGFFDVIAMSDLIEHLPDPKHSLVEVRRILNNSGILYINTPDIASLISKLLRAKWWGVNKFHLFYFSKKTLENMLDACGFKVKKYSPHLRIFSVNYWLKRFSIYNNTLYRFMDFIFRISKFQSKLLRINFHDQLEVIVVKSRKLDYLVGSLAAKKEKAVRKKMKVIVALPAYNAEKTLKRTLDDIPRDSVDKIILVDDASSDKTVEVAKSLGLEVFQHSKNKGFGGNQKTCCQEALKQGADIVVMVHPDYQYDPTIIPELIEPIQKGEADLVFGSRMMKGGALDGGMPPWKHNANILLTAFANIVLGTYLTEYHSGFRAYSADLLKTVRFKLNSDKFVFDTEIIVQALVHHFKIEEVPIQTRYFDEASQIKFLPCIAYGFGIIWTMVKYILHSKGIYKFKQFS
ncbi:MAG: methyltransferase domain-containing protein [Candidatus Omnitrophica bacterium]|nr:methyltransferase domain-containing protein [Candidatus Omnitrophota bacterium]MBU2251193.1 methyltransferase domain-containing protein [Candidatus Omnitrophota bacterium]